MDDYLAEGLLRLSVHLVKVSSYLIKLISHMVNQLPFFCMCIFIVICSGFTCFETVGWLRWMEHWHTGCVRCSTYRRDSCCRAGLSTSLCSVTTWCTQHQLSDRLLAASSSSLVSSCQFCLQNSHSLISADWSSIYTLVQTDLHINQLPCSCFLTHIEGKNINVNCRSLSLPQSMQYDAQLQLTAYKV